MRSTLIDEGVFIFKPTDDTKAMGICQSYPYSVYIVTERNQTILTTYHLDRAEALLQAPCRELIVYSPDQPNRRPVSLGHTYPLNAVVKAALLSPSS